MYFRLAIGDNVRSDLNVFWPESRDFTSDFKNFRGFTPYLRYIRSDIKRIIGISGSTGISGISDQISGHFYTGF